MENIINIILISISLIIGLLGSAIVLAEEVIEGRIKVSFQLEKKICYFIDKFYEVIDMLINYFFSPQNIVVEEEEQLDLSGEDLDCL